MPRRALPFPRRTSGERALPSQRPRRRRPRRHRRERAAEEASPPATGLRRARRSRRRRTLRTWPPLPRGGFVGGVSGERGAALIPEGSLLPLLLLVSAGFV